jgi:predicted alpha/beta superfamily hydrolase
MLDHECQESTRAKGQLIRVGPFDAWGLPEQPRLTVYLPPGYAESGREHSLAIFFDGQNLFDDEGSYQGGWQLHRLLDYRACQGEPVPIVAAIHTDGWSRSAALSPWPRDGVPGLGDQLLNWITAWLIPTLRAELRVRPGPEGVLLGGSSLGGLLSLYGFFRHPEQIGRVLAMSPSLAAGEGQHGPLFPFVAESPHRGGKIYLDAGARECQCTNIQRHTGDLAGLLAHKGYRPGIDLLLATDPDGSHDEASWKRRLPGALELMCQA